MCEDKAVNEAPASEPEIRGGDKPSDYIQRTVTPPPMDDDEGDES